MALNTSRWSHVLRRAVAWAALAGALSACSDASSDPQPSVESASPSDDPAEYEVDDSVEYEIVRSEPRFVIPSDGLPPEAPAAVSNANVDIIYHQGRLYMAWRAAPFHFASPDTELRVVSSADDGVTWDYEHTIFLGTDMREPRFVSLGGKLQLLFFEAGSNRLAFEPKKSWRARALPDGSWSELETLVDGPEVPWRVKTRGGQAWMTSYAGGHYAGGDVDVFFKQSTDGDSWSLVDSAPYVYRGGVSEVAFEFDTDGSLWAVGRNEDGDATGWGANVCYAPANALSEWQCSDVADPERYDSPDMFRHGKDIYLIARRDIGGPFGVGGDEGDLAAYSGRPKTSALYQIDKQLRKVVHLFDLPGAGDNAFPSVRRTGPHTFVFANYTSPLDNPDISWIGGQISERGTQIYFMTLEFRPR